MLQMYAIHCMIFVLKVGNYPLIIMCNHATADAMLCMYNPAYPQTGQSQTLHHEDYHFYTAGYGCSCHDAQQYFSCRVKGRQILIVSYLAQLSV